ncbi:MAG: hypothetical protein ACFE75_10240, partial [Candidatus Hodarchaeota archaeon]
AIGDLIWILNGTTSHDQIRDFFIYFNNGSSSAIPKPNYDLIRLWHEGFEEYQTGDILSPTDGQDREPNLWEISSSASARGASSLRIWGNCWKVSYTGNININSDTRVTAKIRLDDPSIQREISGLGFHTIYTNVSTSSNSYNIRGSQLWGDAGSYKFRNLYNATNTFFWYTFELDNEISLGSFSYIFYIADDDTTNWLNLYWDDISIWAKPVQTTPNNSLQTTLGDIQPIIYTLKVTCKDEDGNAVPNAHIYITNDLNPSYNQDHATDINGVWIFEDIEKDAFYNITVNYTQNGLSNPKIVTVFYYENFLIIQLNNQLTAYLNLIKLNFNVTDKDNDPIQYGFVLLKNGTDTVGKSLLSDSGTGSITWVNNTAYDYEIYYDYDSIPDNSRYRYSNLQIYSAAVSLKNIDVSTEFTKIIFNVTDNTPETVPFTNAKLRFYNQSDYDNENEIIANVSVDINGLATFISFSNNYGNWGNYSVDIYFGGDKRPFHTNAGPLENEYNFTLVSQDYAKIEIPLNKDLYNSTINIIDYNSNVFWGNYISININFSAQDPIIPNPTLVTPNELYIQIFTEEITPFSGETDILFSEISTGIFNYTFNTATFNLVGGNSYYFKIVGNYKSYVFNDIGYSLINIQAIPTDIKFYNYSLSELVDKRISVVYQELVNITIDYFDANTGFSLDDALIAYSWDYGSGTLSDDPIHADLYFFEFDSTPAPSAAEYIIDFVAILSNYSTITDSIIVSIISRPTSINDSTSLFQRSPVIFIHEMHNYTFLYRDILTDEILGNLDVVSYYWNKLDDNGNPLTGPGNEGSDNLVEGSGNQYILDFDTETREVGVYTIFITLQKSNYEVRNAFITITIIKREMFISGLPNLVEIASGAALHFKITLTDPNSTIPYAPITEAYAYLTIGGNVYNFTDNGDGTYTINTPKIADPFFMPQTFSATLTIEKEDFSTRKESFIIVVKMQEILGIPTFYFLMIIGAVIAVVGSLAGYRIIQQHRIPIFVKKARSMKKNIKSNKVISESLLYASKEEYIVQKLRDKWELLGLNLDDIMGVKEKKKKKFPEVKEELKGGAL